MLKISELKAFKISYHNSNIFLRKNTPTNELKTKIIVPNLNTHMTWKSKMLPNHTYCLIRVLLIFQRKLYKFSSIFWVTPETFDFLPFTVLTSYLTTQEPAATAKKIHINKKLFAINIKKANGTVYSSPTPYPKKKKCWKNQQQTQWRPSPIACSPSHFISIATGRSIIIIIAQHSTAQPWPRQIKQSNREREDKESSTQTKLKNANPLFLLPATRPELCKIQFKSKYWKLLRLFIFKIRKEGLDEWMNEGVFDRQEQEWEPSEENNWRMDKNLVFYTQRTRKML